MLSETIQRKKATAEIKRLYRYFNHQFLQQSETAAKIREHLKRHLRRMTPAIVESLSESRKKLEHYFRSEHGWYNEIFMDDLDLKQEAMEFGYMQYTRCQAKREPLALNRQGEAYCSYNGCTTPKCLFKAIVARGEEIVFLTNLKKCLQRTEKINRPVREVSWKF